MTSLIHFFSFFSFFSSYQRFVSFSYLELCVWCRLRNNACAQIQSSWVRSTFSGSNKSSEQKSSETDFQLQPSRFPDSIKNIFSSFIKIISRLIVYIIFYTNCRGGFLSPKQGKKVHTHMFVNVDQFHGLHVRPTSVFWIFISGAT